MQVWLSLRFCLTSSVSDASLLDKNPFIFQFDSKNQIDEEEEYCEDAGGEDTEAGKEANLEPSLSVSGTVTMVSSVTANLNSFVSDASPLDLLSSSTVALSSSDVLSTRFHREIHVESYCEFIALNKSNFCSCQLGIVSTISLWKDGPGRSWSELWPPDFLWCWNDLLKLLIFMIFLNVIFFGANFMFCNVPSSWQNIENILGFWRKS